MHIPAPPHSLRRGSMHTPAPLNIPCRGSPRAHTLFPVPGQHFFRISITPGFSHRPECVIYHAMKPRTIALDAPILSIWKEIRHTLAMVKVYPFLAAQVAPVQPFVQSWLQLMQAEMALQLELEEAENQLIVADDELDVLCPAIAATLLAEFGDRDHAEYQRYFKGIRPSDLCRPILGAQLDTMRTWVPSLLSSTSQPLRDLGNRLAQCIIEADQAVTAHSEAERKQADFVLRTRKPFIDALNAMRLALYGQVAEMPHKRSELKLLKNFANRFFMRSRKKKSRPLTIPELERVILRKRADLARDEAQLRQLEEERAEEQSMRENAEYEEAERALAEAERVRAEAEARMEELRTRLRGRGGADENGNAPAPAESEASDSEMNTSKKVPEPVE
jgi:hypothetical protein